MPLVFVNLVGANDELIFDGGSFVLGGESLKRFEEEVRVMNLATEHTENLRIEERGEEEVFKA
jgi:hypothetical protein